MDRGSVVSHKKSKEEGTVIGFDGRTKINVVKKDGSHATWYSDQTMLTKHHSEPGPHNTSAADQRTAALKAHRMDSGLTRHTNPDNSAGSDAENIQRWEQAIASYERQIKTATKPETKAKLRQSIQKARANIDRVKAKRSSN